ncbi:MAG: CDP-diacylglycerol--glycerol-3-phosphate 3-phosphatidyltransferase [SAR324 cluster bacterium]|nr:CDP-diacylglycerol--glycerol-3-phosphate 3-phosphatidyltransferase [SAR324 cluster bacterium]
MIHFFKKWITPNQLTVLRIALIPVVYFMVTLDTRNMLFIGWILFAFACFTDYWDGLLARHTDTTTDFGKLLDPIADKILIAAILILLVSMGRAPAYLAAIIIGREFAISAMRSIAASKGVVIPASSGGKIKTISQMLAVGFLIIHYDTLWIPCHAVGTVLLWIATVITLWSGVDYFLAFRKVTLTASET